LPLAHKMEPTLHRILEFTVPISSAGFGLQIEATTNRVAEMAPNGAAAHAGLRMGDIIMVVNGESVTAVEWAPGPDESSVFCGPPTATVPASAGVDHSLPAATFTVLRHEGRYAEDAQAEVMRRLESAEGGVGQRYQGGAAAPPQVAPSPAQLSAEEAPPSAWQADPFEEGRRQYPWATEISTSDGQLKTKYNITRGTALQPLPQLQADLAAKERKKAFAANPRVSGSVGVSHAASGSTFR